MVRVNQGKRILFVILTYAFQLVLLKFYCESHTYTSLLNIQFLNFKSFSDFHLNSFSLEFIIPFVIMFYVIYNSQIEFLDMQVLFFTMYLHKKSKKSQFKEILINCFKDNLIVVLLLTGMMTLKIIIDKHIEIQYFICGVIYFVRYQFIIFTVVSILKIKALTDEIHLEAMIPYVVFIICLLIDYIFKTNLITYTSDVKLEIVYFSITTIVGTGFICINMDYFLKGDLA